MLESNLAKCYSLVSFGFLYEFEIGNLKQYDFKIQICCNIVNFLKSHLCSKIASFCFIFLQVSRLLGAFKNQKQVTRSFGSAVSIIVPSFSFKKFLKKGVQKLTLIRLLLLLLQSQKIRPK